MGLGSFGTSVFAMGRARGGRGWAWGAGTGASGSAGPGLEAAVGFVSSFLGGTGAGPGSGGAAAGREVGKEWQGRHPAGAVRFPGLDWVLLAGIDALQLEEGVEGLLIHAMHAALVALQDFEALGAGEGGEGVGDLLHVVGFGVAAIAWSIQLFSTAQQRRRRLRGSQFLDHAELDAVKIAEAVQVFVDEKFKMLLGFGADDDIAGEKAVANRVHRRAGLPSAVLGPSERPPLARAAVCLRKEDIRIHSSSY